MAFDDDLRRAFRREAPPEGFTERTIAAIGLRSARAARRRSRAWFGGAAAAAILLLVIGAGGAYRARQQAARARQDVEIGLRVASEKLDHVQRRLIEASRRRGDADAL